jgi:hypothetical protein
MKCPFGLFRLFVPLVSFVSLSLWSLSVAIYHDLSKGHAYAHVPFHVPEFAYEFISVTAKGPKGHVLRAHLIPSSGARVLYDARLVTLKEHQSAHERRRKS